MSIVDKYRAENIQGFASMPQESWRNLWLEGRGVWNKWVEENQKADPEFKAVVIFSGFDFSKHRDVGNIEPDRWPFRGYKFPNGHVDFSNATFGKGNVSFSGATFGEGHVNFSDATFGEGDVSFSNATFREGNVFFLHTTLGKGDVSFSRASFGEGDVSFFGATFKGKAIFSLLENVKELKSFSFTFCTFEGPLSFSAIEPFTCIPDFTENKLSHHLSLEGINVSYNRKWRDKNGDNHTETIERLRRLKELAENNKDHQKALDFHVLEMKASRTQKRYPLIQNIIDSEFWFDILSDYGRSVARPVKYMFCMWVLFAKIYFLASYAVFVHSAPLSQRITSALTYSAANMFPFVSSSRDARPHGLETLFDKAALSPENQWYMDVIFGVAFLQSFLAIVLLFLFGLALKHKFKL